MNTKRLIASLYINPLLLVGLITGAIAQPNWEVVPTEFSHTIFIPSETALSKNGESIALGDFVGVFYRGANAIWQCAGFAEWQGQSTFITAYGAADGFPGLQAGEAFKFKIWDTVSGCAFPAVNADFGTGPTVTHQGNFAPNGISLLTDLHASSVEIRFAERYCLNDEVIFPEVTEGVNTGIRFGDLPDGLALNASQTGIDLALSFPGTYIITWETEDCLNSNIATLRVEGFYTEGEVFRTEALCGQPFSQVLVEADAIREGATPFTFSFQNDFTNETLSFLSGGPIALPQGDYVATITDAAGCSVTLPNLLEIRTSNCEAVITPNQDGRQDRYFIPYNGMATVFDRNGSQQARFPIPSEWDGKNNVGVTLPSGLYLIYCSEGQQISLNIIK